MIVLYIQILTLTPAPLSLSPFPFPPHIMLYIIIITSNKSSHKIILGKLQHTSAEAVHSTDCKVVRSIRSSNLWNVLDGPGCGVERSRASKVDWFVLGVKLGQCVHQNIEMDIHVVVNVTEPATGQKGKMNARGGYKKHDIIHTMYMHMYMYMHIMGKHPCTTFQGATVAASIQMCDFNHFNPR